MTKHGIDNYFTENHIQILEWIESSEPRCFTNNVENIISDVYLACINSMDKIPNEKKLGGFIRITATSIYKWSNSEFNQLNKVESNNIEVSNIYIQEDNYKHEKEMRLQSFEYALEKYWQNASKSERIFYKAYINEGIRTVRAIRDHFGVTYRGSQRLIKDFKQKIKEYEREIEEV